MKKKSGKKKNGGKEGGGKKHTKPKRRKSSTIPSKPNAVCSKNYCKNTINWKLRRKKKKRRKKELKPEN